MKIETIANVIASGVLAAGVSAFMVLLYRSGGLVEKFPMTGSILLRISLAGTAAGSLANCLTLSTPNGSEILTNCSLAGIFAWAVWFHAKLIKNHGSNSKHHSRDDEGSSR